ncbi:MAG TPA: Ig-like domain-containing protein [Holophagaceae bacterium]|nr:Ig-like domain-containing protein [Holophagaceae bacterium]
MTRASLSPLALCLALGGSGFAQDVHPDHHELEAYLGVPFRGAAGEARTIQVAFDFHTWKELCVSAWRLELRTEGGRTLRSWTGETPLLDRGKGFARVAWDGRDAQGRALPAGFYTMRLSALALSNREHQALPGGDRAARVAALHARPGVELEVQETTLQVGRVKAPALLPFRALPTSCTPVATARAEGLAAPAAGSLPYTVYYGNLHSQTNHSDGGGSGDCHSEQAPQGGLGGGPTEAYESMRVKAGSDFLLTSEHNHMYDGAAMSTSTPQRLAPAARALHATGRQLAAQYRAAHPGFVAMYGNEWGYAASTGGHLNLLNPDGLPGWEKDSNGDLYGDVETPTGDYPALYATMKARGWMGMFNHPSSSQFNGLAYDANGDAVMFLCEMRNAPAFSNIFDESSALTSGYESTYKAILSKGFHVAPTSDQDNHCANWGLSALNRTGILVPTGTSFDLTALLDAVRARHVFATTDKTGQIVMTANGRLMGAIFDSSGSLTLNAYYASSGGHTAARVEFYEGAKGVAVTSLSDGPATLTLTPTTGDHFYYAKITQEDGGTLWSAPVWINQKSGTVDTQAPTVSATETGTKGPITLAATATDNVGVAKVEFYVDGALKGSTTAAPYSLGLDSTTLTNASHNLVAKAYDAAGNVGQSAPVAFTLSNPIVDGEPPVVSASESGTSGTITLSATASDNVGVSKVEFYVDGVLKGSDATAPYSLGLDSATLANGSHSLVAKAHDAAGNVGQSAALPFSLANGGSTTFSETEPNSSRAAANVVGDTVTKITGYFPSASDSDDYYKLTLAPGRTLTVDMVGPTASSQDYDLYLLNSTGSQLALSENGGTTEHLSYKNTSTTATKTLYLQVHRYASYSSVTPYTLTLSR